MRRVALFFSAMLVVLAALACTEETVTEPALTGDQPTQEEGPTEPPSTGDELTDKGIGWAQRLLTQVQKQMLPGIRETCAGAESEATGDEPIKSLEPEDWDLLAPICAQALRGELAAAERQLVSLLGGDIEPVLVKTPPAPVLTPVGSEFWEDIPVPTSALLVDHQVGDPDQDETATYQVAGGAADVMSFYKAYMPQFGWDQEMLDDRGGLWCKGEPLICAGVDIVEEADGTTTFRLAHEKPGQYE